MSFVLNAEKTTTKNLCAKTYGGGPPFGMAHQGVYLTIFDPNGDTPVAEIGMTDFCALVYYVLTNADLEPDDPRRRLFECLKISQIIPGRNTGAQRINIPGYGGTLSKPKPKPNVPIATHRLNKAIEKHDSNDR